MQFKVHQSEEDAFVGIDRGDGKSRDLGPRAVRVVAILEELARCDEGREEHPPSAQYRAVLLVILDGYGGVGALTNRLVDGRERGRGIGCGVDLVGTGTTYRVSNLSTTAMEVVEGDLERRARGAGATEDFCDEESKGEDGGFGGRRSRGGRRGSPNGFNREYRRAWRTTKSVSGKRHAGGTLTD